MASFFGFEPVFMPIARAPRFLRPLQYVVHAIRSLLLLYRRDPQIIWVQLPQVPLLTAALLYRRLFARNAKIVADCHNLMFDAPWRNWPFVTSKLNKADLILVHNREIVSKAVTMRIRRSIIHPLEDCPAAIRVPGISSPRSAPPSFLFLTWFELDEPIKELYEAALLAPELRFIIAGDTRCARGRHKLRPHPPNVELVGYLSGMELDAAIVAADALLGLTKHPDEQLSTAAEAVGAGKAMVLSDTKLLREMYYKGAVYVDVFDPKSIVGGCRKVLEHRSRLELESRDLNQERVARWREHASVIKDLLQPRPKA